MPKIPNDMSSAAIEKRAAIAAAMKAVEAKKAAFAHAKPRTRKPK